MQCRKKFFPNCILPLVGTWDCACALCLCLLMLSLFPTLLPQQYSLKLRHISLPFQMLVVIQSKWPESFLVLVNLSLYLFTVLPATQASLLLSISGNSTLLSPNRTFELGFFSVDGGSNFYLGIWYASIPIRTYVWLANRRSPIPSHLTPPTAALIPSGLLAVTDSAGSLIWSTDNSSPATDAKLLDTGNLVLLTSDGRTAWQSFDFPADTWLPDMNVTNLRPLVSWRGRSDPSPGPYSLRLRPPGFGEFELVFNGSTPYWSTGNWTGSRFAEVPEMTVPYIYSFRFFNPFTPDASFVYSETPPAELSAGPVLSRFVVDSSGQIMQYTWSSQAATWNMFWSRPESACRVYGRCGSLGFCSDGALRPCECLAGMQPVDPDAWNSGDFSGGCAAESSCSGDSDGFSDAGTVDFDGGSTVSFPGISSRESCEDSCRSNCSCFAIKYDAELRLCVNVYGSAYNLRNNTAMPILYLRWASSAGSHGGGSTKNSEGKLKTTVLIAGIIGTLFAVFASMSLILVLLLKFRGKRWRERKEEEGIIMNYPVMNLKVFAYKELSAATRGFSEKLGHGGFGAVFLGELPDSTPVAVKRLERPGGGGDREFRAEVRTIGSIQHVNLVRLHGFCSEEAHRLLVYDYMLNGSLSSYLNHRDENRPLLSWQRRFQIAIGTARGIAYLHEECRDCIIHCDIKPENILLDGEYRPKVSDFGLAKLMGRDFSRVLATMRGTWGYVAPEWISGVAITAKADVYSYGMTLLEILGGRRNVEAPATEAEEAAEGGWFFPPWAARKILEGDVAGVVDPRLGKEYEEREAERAGLVAVWCIQDEETARPTMGEVVKMLEGTVAARVPPLPKLLQALVSGDSFPRAGIVSDTSCNSNGTSLPSNN